MSRIIDFYKKFGRLPVGKELEELKRLGKQEETRQKILPFPEGGKDKVPPKKQFGGDTSELTDADIEEYSLDLGDPETWYEPGMTVQDAEKALQSRKAYEEAMFRDYKAGKLDPQPGEKTEARRRFLEKKAVDAQISGDDRLFTLEEAEELNELEAILDFEKQGREKVKKFPTDKIKNPFKTGKQEGLGGLLEKTKKLKEMADELADTGKKYREQTPGDFMRNAFGLGENPYDIVNQIQALGNEADIIKEVTKVIGRKGKYADITEKDAEIITKMIDQYIRDNFRGGGLAYLQGY